MDIRSSVFVKSVSRLEDCPQPDIPEYAFTGRSNVGKSSLINMLSGRKNLAKTSNVPGKTQLINYFLIDDSWFLADLPGIGYARVSKKTRSGWNRLIRDYLVKRRNLLNVFMLVDCRLAPQAIDLAFIHQLGEWQLPFSIVFTKTDKLSKNELHRNITFYKSELLKEWEELPMIFYTSSVSLDGKEKLLDFIENTNPVFRQ